MSNGLTARDIERVSAYLDNALPWRERGPFEERLKSEPTLAQAVAQLHRTQALLHRSPQRRVPRSFAVKADMVSRSPKAAFGGWSSLNLVSAAATLVLVLVFAGDIWAGGMPLFGAAAPAAEEAPQALMAQESSAEDAALTATPTMAEPEGAGEIELYAEPEQVDRLAKDERPFDFRMFLIGYARPMEIGLAAIAIVAGLIAWRQRRKA